MAEKASPAPTPNQNLVRVFDTEQEAEAMVVRGLLDSAGIDCDVVGENSPDVLPVGGVAVLVREEDAARARQLLAEYERSPEEARQEAELDDALVETGSEKAPSEDQEPEG